MYRKFYFHLKIDKAILIIRFGEQWATGADNIMRYVGEEEIMICIDTRANFEGFVVKICYCFKINRSQSYVHIFTPNVEWKAL